MLKILLNSPCNYHTSYEILTNPIGLSYIKHFCEEQDPSLDIKIVPFIDRQILLEEKPDIVGLSTYAATYNLVVNIAELCRDFGIHVVVGGEQITSLPHLLTVDMDVGVLGEGEYVFSKLLGQYDNGWDKATLAVLPGLAFWDGIKSLVLSPKAAPIEDLNLLPVPDLLYGNEGSDTLCLMSSRGCPYRCVFCATGWHRSVRWFSPEKVLETIEFHVQKYPSIKRIKFWDDLFTVKKNRVESIVELLEQRGLTEKINYSVATRTDHIDEDLLVLLKRMNCIHISMGMESGSNTTLEYINKGFKAETSRRAAELVDQYGFYSESSFIVGFPFETRDDILETYRFIKSIPIKKFQIFLPIPYPGTELWKYALERNLVAEDDMDWEALDITPTMYKPRQIMNRFIVLSEKLSKVELYGLLRKFGRLARWKTFKYSLLLLVRNPEMILSRIKREIRFFFLRRDRVWRG